MRKKYRHLYRPLQPSSEAWYRAIKCPTLQKPKWLSYVSNAAFQRMVRFGGWQAKHLASVIMLSTQGEESSAGMQYTLPSSNVNPHASYAIIYTIGLVNIDERWLRLIVPDERRFKALMKGDEREFFSE